jgi:hypothetical protein
VTDETKLAAILPEGWVIELRTPTYEAWAHSPIAEGQKWDEVDGIMEYGKTPEEAMKKLLARLEDWAKFRSRLHEEEEQ